MRLLVVNPNTTRSMTEKIAAAARSVAAAGTEIVAVNPSMGPASIEGPYDEALAVPGLLDELIKGEAAGIDANVVACFDDPGLEAARSRLATPVIGICEAAMHAASLVAGNFVVVTTLARAIPTIESLAARYGFARHCRAVRAAEVPVLALEDPTSNAAARVRDEIVAAIAEDGAESILLGCAGMADLARTLTAELGLPVIDGVAAAVKLAEAAVALGLVTAKRGAYAAPLPKDYAGALARFAPR